MNSTVVPKIPPKAIPDVNQQNQSNLLFLQNISQKSRKNVTLMASEPMDNINPISLQLKSLI